APRLDRPSTGPRFMPNHTTNVPSSAALTAMPVLRRPSETNRADRIFRIVTGVFAVSLLGLLVAMGLEMTRASLPPIHRFGWSFSVGRAWDPLHEPFGALPYIFGTVVSSLLALIIAVPLSLGVAISLSELVPRWARAPLGFIVELLAAIPSVV